MFGAKYNEKKLKTNLCLAATRLKLLAKKKAEQSTRNRSEIVEYVRKHKLDCARVRVEHAIQDDYLIEAFELVELHAILLEGRLGLLRKSNDIEDEIITPVSSLIWSSSRLHEHCQELKIVSDQLRAFFGKKFVEACRKNDFGTVCKQLMKCLDAAPPEKSLVEHYLVNICRSANVDYSPTKCYFNETGKDENAAICCGQTRNCIGACSSKCRKNLPQTFYSSSPSYSETDQNVSKVYKWSHNNAKLFSTWQDEEAEKSGKLFNEIPPTYAECIASSKTTHKNDSKLNVTTEFSVSCDNLPLKPELNFSENDLDELSRRLEKLKNED